ncbi:carbon-nitrogen hydrolase [Candidatus Woesearchaeota archaeon]|nr:carbon-nitrogen hydrolase [Candidatus Woesearchaeota archaeon]
MMTVVKLGLIQTKVSNDVKKNLDHTATKVREAAKKGAQIICLQEVFRSTYFPQYEKKDYKHLAETRSGESVTIFSKLAKELGVVILVPIYEKETQKDGEHYYNTVVVIDADGKNLGYYRKVHIPHDPCYWEKDYFEPSKEGFKVFKTRYAIIGVLICYDQWFPEAARCTALLGAELIFYPTAIGYIKNLEREDGDWCEAWQTVQRGHAISNAVPIAAVNRVGVEDKITFYGNSFVADAFGVILGKASKTNEEVLVVSVDLAKNKQIRDGWLFYENRKPHAYKKLVE